MDDDDHVPDFVDRSIYEAALTPRDLPHQGQKIYLGAEEAGEADLAPTAHSDFARQPCNKPVLLALRRSEFCRYPPCQ